MRLLFIIIVEQKLKFTLNLTNKRRGGTDKKTNDIVQFTASLYKFASDKP